MNVFAGGFGQAKGKEANEQKQKQGRWSRLESQVLTLCVVMVAVIARRTSLAGVHFVLYRAQVAGETEGGRARRQ